MNSIKIFNTYTSR